MAIFAYINQDKLINRFIERQSRSISFRDDLLDDTAGITLITVGTGSPLPSERVQACNAVFVNGKYFVFDIGEGASKKMENMRLPIDKIEAVFISHWHSDHYIDLPNLINRSWQLGREHNLDLYGPWPIDSIYEGMRQFLAPENLFRSTHHGHEVMNPDHALVTPHQVQPDLTNFETIYDKDGVIIKAFSVDHRPVSPALGYRIEYNDRSLVISGDTKRSDNLIKHAMGADILVHEAMQMEFVQRAADLQEAKGNARNQQIAEAMKSYHSSPADAAETAQKAGVKKLVLSHLTPAPENPISRRFYTKGLDDIFSGPVFLAEDGEVYFIN